MDKEVSQCPFLVWADDGQCEIDELGPGLGGGAARGRNIVEILLTVHEGEVELPELFRGYTGNLKEGRCNSG